MAKCETCGNDYDKSFTVTIAAAPTCESSSARSSPAPACEHCGCRIIGHGVEANGRYFCCANCAHMIGVEHLADRTEQDQEHHHDR